MPYEMNWFYPKRIIRATYYGVVTFEEIREQALAVYDFIEESVPPVHFILDIDQITRLNTTLPELREIAALAPATEDTGWVIIVGQNRTVRFFAGLGAQFSGARSRYFGTMAEALDFIARHDPTFTPILEGGD